MSESQARTPASFRTTGIGAKLFASFLSMAMLVAIFAVVAGRQTTVLEGNLRRLTDEIIPVLTDVEALSRSVMELSSEALMTETNRRNGKEDAGDLAEQQLALIAAGGMMNASMSSLDLLLIERYKDSWLAAKNKVELFSQLTGEILTRSPDQELPYEGERIEELKDRAISALQEIRVLALDELHERHTSTDRALRRAAIAQRTALIVALCLAILLSFLLTKNFIRPIRELSNAARLVGAGSFGVSVKTFGKDELAKLGEAFNVMSAQLQTTTVSKMELDLILASMTEGLCVIDSGGAIGQTNPAWDKIFPKPEVPSQLQRLSEIWPEAERELERHRASGLTSSSPKEVPLERGIDTLVFRVIFQEVKKLSGRGSETLIVMQDISQSLRSESELREFREKILHAGQLASLGGVAAILSHKLNQPLTVLRLLMQQMTRSLEKPEVLQGKIATALEELDSVSRQIREVLEYSRPLDSAKRMEIDLDPLIRKTAELFVRPYQEEKIELSVDGCRGMPEVFGNQDQLEEAFYILLENALHARPSGRPSAVRIEARVQDERLIVEVSDTGDGIPKAIQSRVFEPFFTTKPRDKGSGLGLARLKQILLAHDGDVWLESEEFKGTTVFLTFPINEASKRNRCKQRQEEIVDESAKSAAASADFSR